MRYINSMSRAPTADNAFTFADLFSGAGGMSYGFKKHPAFTVVGAADAQMGKPSSAVGSLGCNQTYSTNIGVTPLEVDLGSVSPASVRESWGIKKGQLDVLSACPPCTGFSRTTAANHLRDDPRNSLVSRVALFVDELRPRVMVMENARELVTGRQRHHLDALVSSLEEMDYEVSASTHMLTDFGLPQLRERAMVIATQKQYRLRTLEELWRGYEPSSDALTVRRAISHLPPIEAGQQYQKDPSHNSPSFRSEITYQRMCAIPRDGGSWADLIGDRETEKLLNPAHKRIIASGRLGSHPDVYGRLWWDKPARTIKRECAHVGNGRYSHPEQNRLCSVREMGLLQGFPAHFKFREKSLANAYRHIGDAVPPLVAYQLAGVAQWILEGKRPDLGDLCLEGTSLRAEDIVESQLDNLVA